jgi:4-hydroxy-2-oxoheptanedioate aldolase
MGARKSNPALLRKRLRHERLVGTFVKLPSTEILDIVRLAGFDFAIVDLEHSQLTTGDALLLVRHAHALDFPAVVRLPTCDTGLINRLLEAGAAGLQLSTVRSVDDVQQLVAASRYPPAGRRSVSLAHVGAGYGAVPLAEAVTVEPPLLVGQIETADSVDPLDQIASAGLDVVFLGLTDLTVNVAFDERRVFERVEAVTTAATAAGVALGVFASDRSRIPEASRYVALGSDVAMIQRAAMEAASDAS